MLTKIQLVQFQVFGCVVLRGVLTADEIETAGSEFDVGLGLTHESDRSRSGVRGQLNWTNQRPETPFLASLLEDERLYGAAKQILGDDAVGFFARCNSFNGYRTEWHPDIVDRAWRGIKLGFYLDPLDGETGALRLIPGSHNDPFFSDIHQVDLRHSYSGGESGAGLNVEDVPAFIAISEPGDVVIFDTHTWHASYGGGKEPPDVHDGLLRASQDRRTKGSHPQRGRRRRKGSRQLAGGKSPSWVAREPRWQSCAEAMAQRLATVGIRRLLTAKIEPMIYTFNPLNLALNLAYWCRPFGTQVLSALDTSPFCGDAATGQTRMDRRPSREPFIT